MKLLTILVLTLGFSQISMATCSDDHHADASSKSATKSAKATEYTHLLKLDGMSCNSCVKNVKDALKSIKLDKGVKLLVEVNAVTIDYTNNKALKAAELQRIINEAKVAITKAKYKVVEG